MSIDKWLALGQTALELGLVNALTVLALFLSYSMLNVCDLSTDGCFTLGAAVGALVAIAGYPWLSLPAAMLAGMVSGFVTATLQMRMGVQSLLAGIVVNTGLYSLNMALTGNKATLPMNKTVTVFTLAKGLLKGTPLAGQSTLQVLCHGEDRRGLVHAQGRLVARQRHVHGIQARVHHDARQQALDPHPRLQGRRHKAGDHACQHRSRQREPGISRDRHQRAYRRAEGEATVRRQVADVQH